MIKRCRAMRSFKKLMKKFDLKQCTVKLDNIDDIIRKNRKQSHICYVCSKKFDSLECLKIHKSVHAEEITLSDANDSDADKTLSRESESPTVNTRRKKNYTCYACLEKCSSLEHLKIHQAIHENESSSEETGEEQIIKNKNTSAPKPFETINSNTVILPKIQPQDQTKSIPLLKCNTCDTLFNSKLETVLHKPMVSQKSCIFICLECMSTYTTPLAYLAHMIQKHDYPTHDAHLSEKVTKSVTETPSTLKYECSFCKQCFDDCYQLKRHEVFVHKTKTRSKKSPQNFKSVMKNVADASTINSCDICFDIFPSRLALLNHIEFHKTLEPSDVTAPSSYDITSLGDKEKAIPSDHSNVKENAKSLVKKRNRTKKAKNKVVPIPVEVPSQTATPDDSDDDVQIVWESLPPKKTVEPVSKPLAKVKDVIETEQGGKSVEGAPSNSYSALFDKIPDAVNAGVTNLVVTSQSIDSSTNDAPNKINSNSSLPTEKETTKSDEDDEDQLVIDENTASTSKTGSFKPKIFLKSMTELMKPVKDAPRKNLRFHKTCIDCKFVFKKYRSARQHNARKFKCSECDYSHCRGNDTRKHVLESHNLHFCIRCSKSVTPTEASAHYLSHKCNLCKKTFISVLEHQKTCPDKVNSDTPKVSNQ